MPHLLDTPKAYLTYDTNHIAESVGLSIDQIESVISQPRRLGLKNRHRQARTIIICGMGGSNLGSDVLLHVWRDQLRVPIILHRDYGLPAFADRHTLVIASSYSGNTEETLSSIKEAQRRGCAVVGIATGGALAHWCERYRFPFFHIDGGLNPSDQPRLGLGYAIGALLTVLQHGGYLKVSPQSLISSFPHLRRVQRRLLPTVALRHNPAKQLAEALYRRAPIIVAAQHLSGTAHVFANMANENAKTFAAYFNLPELNHHLIEGLSYPTAGMRQLAFVFIESRLYSERLRRRLALTKQIARKMRRITLGFVPTTPSPFGEALEVVQFAGYTTFYLAMLNQVNPGLIPWVNYFKKHLAKK